MQLAKVFVDGREIPDTPWYFCDLPAPTQTAFADTDFEIPVAYTRGKQQMSITVEHVKVIRTRPAPPWPPLVVVAPPGKTAPGGKTAAHGKAAEEPRVDGCNEYYYWVYCYGPTPLETEPPAS